MIRLVLIGAAGRMGRAIEAAAAGDPELTFAARVDTRANFPASGGVWVEDAAEVVAAGDVVIEFSSPAACRAAARLCAERGAGLVSGTTGLGEAEEAEVRAAAAKVPVLRAANFSLGLVALRRALATALEALPAEWDIEIVERHHRQKVDSPSGTALVLAREAAGQRGIAAGAIRSGRDGRVGVRPAAEIGVHSVRGGTWVGDHAVLLAGNGESVELRHVVQDRSAFAAGVLAATRVVANAPPGLYTMDDIPAPPGRPEP